jgi:transposase-like protein
MDLTDVYMRFPTQEDSMRHMAQARWPKRLSCPYCKSTEAITRKNKLPYQCLHCNHPYSPSTNTPFHKTKIDLQKWLLGTYLILHSQKKMTIRELASRLEITRQTAIKMQMGISYAYSIHNEVWLESILKSGQVERKANDQ